MNSPLLEVTGRRRPPRKAALWLILALLLVLLIGLILFLALRPRLPYDLSDYQKALDAGDQEALVRIYDSLRLKRLDFAASRQTRRIQELDLQAASLIARIEEEAEVRSRQILQKARDGQNLTQEDLSELEGLAPLAGHKIRLAALETLGSYLEGHLEEDLFFHFAGEMTKVAFLLREFKALNEAPGAVTRIRGELAKASAAGLEGNTYGQIQMVGDLLADPELAALEPLADYLTLRLDLHWQAYYEDEILEIRQEMAHQRTYDAWLRIRRLLTYYPDDAELLAFQAVCLEKNPPSVITWWDPVDHLAVKPLIADSERAFDGDRYQAAADRELVLTLEFERALEELYAGGYVLVDSRSFAGQDGRLRGIPCPAGKKPLVLVLEDFYGSLPRAESGVAWRLDLNKEGQVVGVLLDKDGSQRADRSYTAIGILEAFIEEHPDFSFNGATGVIALVGEKGLFGYPVADLQDLAYSREAEDMGSERPPLPASDFTYNRSRVRALVQALESRNWVLASGTFGRLSLPFSSEEAISRDLALTRQWVEPYTGSLTALYCPFGDHLEAQQKKARLYTDAGYTLQSGYEAWAYWNAGQGYVYVSRTLMSGAALRQTGLKRFFDARKVLAGPLRP